MKSILAIIISVLALSGYVYSEEPVAIEPAVVQLAAADFDAIDPEYALSTYQKAAIEVRENADLLAKSEKVDIAGFAATKVESSLNCGLMTYNDNSFTALPAGKPYDSNGNEIDVETAEVTSDSPIALLVYHAERAESAKNGDS